MDKIFHSTFEFFSHALPGAIIAVVFMLLNSEIKTPTDFITLASGFNTAVGVVIIVVGYIFGFAVYPVGRWFYRKIGFRVWPKKYTENVPIFISRKFALVRHHSYDNFRYIELWHMFAAMSHNLTVAMLSILLLSWYKMFQLPFQYFYLWLFIGVVAFVLSIAFLYRAVAFSIWAADDLNAAINALKLLDKTEEKSVDAKK